MKFHGAVVKEQGVTFAIVVVKKQVINSSDERVSVAERLVPVFPKIPIVLMAQDERKVPTYFGRKDIVRFLARVSVSRIPWKEFNVA